VRRPRGPKGARAWRYLITGLLAIGPGFTAVFTDNVTLGLIAAGIVLASILIGPVVDPLLIDDRDS
jgi:hypothetical protein